MTPAQMILNSLNGMFQISEAATTRMLEVMEEVDIPEEWESVGLIKQTQELMVGPRGCECSYAHVLYERVDKYWNVTLDHIVWTFSDLVACFWCH